MIYSDDDFIRCLYGFAYEELVDNYLEENREKLVKEYIEDDDNIIDALNEVSALYDIDKLYDIVGEQVEGLRQGRLIYESNIKNIIYIKQLVPTAYIVCFDDDKCVISMTLEGI